MRDTEKMVWHMHFRDGHEVRRRYSNTRIVIIRVCMMGLMRMAGVRTVMRAVNIRKSRCGDRRVIVGMMYVT